MVILDSGLLFFGHLYIASRCWKCRSWNFVFVLVT